MTTWTEVTKNQPPIISEYSLLIGSGFFLNIGDGFKLSIAPGSGDGWQNTTKNTTSWSNVTKN